MRVLIAGCGDVGSRAGVRLAARGAEVFGLKRDPSGLPTPIAPVAADLTDPGSLRSAVPSGITHLAYTASADGRDPERYRQAYVDGLRHVLDVVRGNGDAPRVVFTASTAVYGQDDGSWVDEDSPTEPTRFTGDILLEAEELVHAADGTSLRLAGIYGPGRGRLIERVRAGDEVCVDGRDAWTNRIHADDAGAALAHLLTIAEPASVYVGVDDEPVRRCEVITWLAERLGVRPPRHVPPDDADARARGGSKRCRNDRLRASGWSPAYRSFREGYAELLGA